MFLTVEVSIAESSRGGWDFSVYRRFPEGRDGHPVSEEFVHGWTQTEAAAKELAFHAVPFAEHVEMG